MKLSKVVVLLSLFGFAASGMASVAGAPVQPACLQTSLSVAEPTAKWSTAASLDVVNNCSTAIDLNNTAVSFKSNAESLSSVWTWPFESTATYQNGVAEFTLVAQAGQSAATTLKPGASVSLDFEATLAGTPFDLAAAQQSLAVVPNDAPVANNGELDLNVNPAGVTGTPGTELIQVSSGSFKQQINQSDWSAQSVHSLKDLAYGTYTISADSIPGYKAVVTPATVVVNGSTPVSATVTYQVQAAIGTLNVVMPSAPLENISDKTDVTVTDQQTSQVYSQSVAWNGTANFTDMPAGDTYSISVPSMSNGQYMAVPNAVPDVSVSENQLSTANVSYQVKPVSTTQVSFNLSGLSAADATLSLTDTYGNQYEFKNLGNGTVQESLPTNNSYNIKASASGLVGRADVTNFNTPMQSPVSVAFSAAPAPGQGLLIGYLDLSAGNDPSIADAVSHGYNMIIIGWGKVAGDQATVWPDTLVSDPNLAADIAAAHEKGVKVLLTFGGMNNTFVPPANASAQDAQTIADQMIALSKTYGFDGFDFDLENTDVPYSAAFLGSLIQDLKSANPSLIITGAPQIHGLIGSGWNYMGFAPVANGPDWNQLVASDLFDYILVQAYNQGGGAEIVANGQKAGTMLDDSDPGFLTGAYEALQQGYLPNYPGAAPGLNAPGGWTAVAFDKLHTHLVIGVPSVVGDWRGADEGVANPAEIVAQFNCLETGAECTTYKPAKTYQSVGLMTWSVAGDQYVKWSFSDGVKACVVDGQC